LNSRVSKLYNSDLVQVGHMVSVSFKITEVLQKAFSIITLV
jgi:hypothetical protein